MNNLCLHPIVLAAYFTSSHLVMMLYVQVSGPKKMNITLATSIATPTAKMKTLHITKTVVVNVWNEDTTKPTIESATVANAAFWL